jgi:2-methylisocitrate lyase-like PEP mutase family enzyme
MNDKIQNKIDDACSNPPLRASTRLRQMLQDRSQLPLACPGVYDGLTARLALSQGYKALYMTGAGVSLSRIGMADLGLATMTEMVTAGAMIAQLDPTVPVIADADTGYGGTLNVARTTREYIRAGIAGFHLEDQVVNKRCGHLAGKQVVDLKEYVSRIRAAVNARKEVGSDIVIIARSDALAVTGFDDAVARLRAAVDAGADVAFLEAIHTKEEAQRVCDIFNPLGVPVMYGLVQGSSAPRMSVREAGDMGFSIMVYAAVCLIPFVRGVETALKTLQEQGECEDYGKDGITPPYLFEICALKELSQFDANVGDEVDKILEQGKAK